MKAIFRPLAAISVVAATIAAVSPVGAMPLVHSSQGDGPSNLVKVHDDGYGYHRYHRRYYSGRNVVHAPFTRVESGRRTVVDAPFVHVYDGRHGTHVVAPFVDLWR